VAVVIKASKERSGRVLAYVLLQEVRSARMFVEEVAYVVDEACDTNQGTGLRLPLVIFPGDDWEVRFLRRPKERFLFMAEAFELHSQFTLLYFVVRKSLEMCGESKLFARPKEPLGRIVLIPLVTIAIIHRELVVEVVISLSHRDDRRNHVILRSVFVVIWLVTKPVT